MINVFQQITGIVIIVKTTMIMTVAALLGKKCQGLFRGLIIHDVQKLANIHPKTMAWHIAHCRYHKHS
jgi:hypothetical protein